MQCWKCNGKPIPYNSGSKEGGEGWPSQGNAAVADGSVGFAGFRVQFLYISPRVSPL